VMTTDEDEVSVVVSEKPKTGTVLNMIGSTLHRVTTSLINGESKSFLACTREYNESINSKLFVVRFVLTS